MTATAAERIDRLAELVKEGCPPYTGAGTSRFRCGHPYVPDNFRSNGPGRAPSCAICVRARVSARVGGEPARCGSCKEPLGYGGIDVYHSGSCEPTTCTCVDGGNPDGLGECGNCHRLVLSHSWHLGAPGRERIEAA